MRIISLRPSSRAFLIRLRLSSMKVSTMRPPFSQGVGGYRNRRGRRRLSVVAVALVRQFDPAFAKRLADFGVFPKQRVYPRV